LPSTGRWRALASAVTATGEDAFAAIVRLEHPPPGSTLREPVRESFAMIQGKVIILDNDRTTQDALQRLFISRAWEVVVVLNPSDALAMLKDYPPDWIVADSSLLDNERDFMTRARARQSCARFVLIGGQSSGNGRATSRSAQPEARFLKPIQPETIYAACAADEPGKAGARLVPPGAKRK
jgi:ActR/RegA family two-component response regulator